ncbi:RNA polymerase sigma-70 factor (ECF subfamily) [Lutibacter oceani]|uniref:RNA polymerase sigma-70 factor (ECF subfamily) n=1 Tax=Lutibacter oceani TaxID=1853311 RepID=A0A3D9RK73_9FLAO|nr:sigma-70 family RNA polymerase sigma factor [Lutibacter oceani]REE79928.1 RNA polymerase sigma-70 factor (ECF subfamily) [Lutibacter oceani]
MSKTILLNSKIVNDCKLNKAKAQMQLYDMYCDAMFIIAQRYVKDNFVAEDIMQDAFIKVFKNIKKFKGEVTIGAWIKKIVINQCIDYLKKKRIELVAIEENNIAIADESDWTVNEEVNINIVTSAINKLPEKYKVVLNLYLIEGYDHQEIAQILNITEVTSRSQLMRGKNKLKSQLKTYNYA